MFKIRPLAAAAATALAVFLALPALAQEVTGLDATETTAGEIVRVSGTDLGNKPKLVLVADGKPAKKTKLKVVETGADFADVLVKKAYKGTFRVAVKKGKKLIGTSADTLSVVPPQIREVDPQMASPGATLVLTVEFLGTGKKVRAGVGLEDATILTTTDIGDGLTELSIRVPDLPNGVWPVVVENDLGRGIVKNGVEIVGSSVPPLPIGATVDIDGLKPLRTDQVGIDEESGNVNVAAVGGNKKKPLTFGISLPGTIESLMPAQVFDQTSDGGGLPGADPALIQITTSRRKGKSGLQIESVFSTTSNLVGEDFAISIVSISEQTLVFFVCGKVRNADPDGLIGRGKGPECVEVFGVIVSPLDSPDVGGDGCNPLTDAFGSITGDFDSVPEGNIALYGVTGPGVLDVSSATGGSPPAQALNFRVSFDPFNDATPATFDRLVIPSGTGLTAFSLTLADATVYGQVLNPETLVSSMSVTITKVSDVPANNDGIRKCIEGSFVGTITKGAGPSAVTQNFQGDFEIPLYDIGFGQ